MGTGRWTSIPSQLGVETLLEVLCYGNRDKLRVDEPPDSYEDFTLINKPVVPLHLLPASIFFQNFVHCPFLNKS